MKTITIKTENGYRLANIVESAPIDSLPAAVYDVVPGIQGIEMVKSSDLLPVPKKILGKETPSRVDNIFSEYKEAMKKSSLGALISGKPGSGKSILVNSICNRAIKMGIPVFNITYPISHHELRMLANANTQCVMLFDEITQTYREIDGESTLSTLTTYLSDESITGALNLMVTNFIDMIPMMFLNRPGRAAFDIRLSNATKSEVEDIYADLQNRDIVPYLVRSLLTTGHHTFDEHRRIATCIKRHPKLDDLILALDDSSVYTIQLRGLQLLIDKGADNESHWRNNISYLFTGLFTAEVSITPLEGETVSVMVDVTSSSSVMNLRSKLVSLTDSTVSCNLVVYDMNSVFEMIDRVMTPVTFPIREPEEVSGSPDSAFNDKSAGRRSNYLFNANTY